MKPFAKRLIPLDEWVLVHVAEPKVVAPNEFAMVEKRNGKNVVVPKNKKENVGVVLAVGPGARNPNTGELSPIDRNVKVGATVLFMGKVRQRPEDFRDEMAAEGLWFVPASAIVCAVEPLEVEVGGAIEA